jgi:hypothetical protein
MNKKLINQINRAVDCGDELVKYDLLLQAGEVKRFIKHIYRHTPAKVAPIEYAPQTDEAELIAYLVHVLSFYFFQLEEDEKAPRWLRAWHQKAQAWHIAVNLEIWDESYDL